MPSYEYSVIPAPKRGVKGKGIKGAEAQFANALTQLMNEAAADGWEYLRAETLPAEERQGLTGRTTVFQNMLVFRRALPEQTAEARTEQPLTLPDPEPDTAPIVEEAASEGPEADTTDTQPEQDSNSAEVLTAEFRSRDR